jgi:hypothetical protein
MNLIFFILRIRHVYVKEVKIKKVACHIYEVKYKRKSNRTQSYH